MEQRLDQAYAHDPLSAPVDKFEPDYSALGVLNGTVPEGEALRSYNDLKRQRKVIEDDRSELRAEQAEFEQEQNSYWAAREQERQAVEFPGFDSETEATARKNAGVAPDTIADTAIGLVYGDRQAQYGHPDSDFRATGRINGATIGRWLESEGYELTIPASPGTPTQIINFPDIPPRVVALMMQGVKLSREASNPKEDNRIDGIGYWLCTDRIVKGETA